MEKHLVVVFLLAIGLFGFSGVSEGNPVQREQATCNTLFVEADSDGRGYVDFLEFKRAWNGPLGYGRIGPHGNARSAFQSADNNGNGRLSAEEYCIWKAHS